MTMDWTIHGYDFRLEQREGKNEFLCVWIVGQSRRCGLSLNMNIQHIYDNLEVDSGYDDF